MQIPFLGPVSADEYKADVLNQMFLPNAGELSVVVGEALAHDELLDAYNSYFDLTNVHNWNQRFAGHAFGVKVTVIQAADPTDRKSVSYFMLISSLSVFCLMCS